MSRTARLCLLAAAVGFAVVLLARGGEREPDEGTSRDGASVAPRPGLRGPPTADRGGAPGPAPERSESRVPGSVRGVVLGEQGEPLADARVALEPDPESDPVPGEEGDGGSRVATTDHSGSFSFVPAPTRTFGIRVVCSGHVTGRFCATPRAEGSYLVLRLRRGSSVRVRVEDEAGAPVAGARVSLYPAPRVRFLGYPTFLRLDRTVTTGSDGSCLLTGLAERHHRVTAFAEGVGAADGSLLAGRRETVLRLARAWSQHAWTYGEGPGRTVPPCRLPPTDPEPPPARPESPEPEPEPAEPAPPEPPPPAEGRLRVRAVSADGVAVPEVFLETEGPASESEFTGDDGIAVLDLPPGAYALAASPYGFGTPAADVRATADVRAGAEAEVEVVLPRVFAVRIEVRDATDRPVPRARLAVLRGDSRKGASTGDDGRLVVFAERGEPLSLLAEARGLPVAVLRDLVVPAPGPVLLRVPEPGEIRGRVVDPGGSPVFGALVRGERSGLGGLGEEVWTAWTDEDGGFVLVGPAAAPYAVSAYHDAYRAAEAVVDPAKATGPATLRLRPLVRLRGRVLDAEGAPVPAALVEVEEGRFGVVETDEDGAFRLAVTAPGDGLRLAVGKEGFARRVLETTAAEGDLEVRLSRDDASR